MRIPYEPKWTEEKVLNLIYGVHEKLLQSNITRFWKNLRDGLAEIKSTKTKDQCERKMESLKTSYKQTLVKNKGSTKILQIF